VVTFYFCAAVDAGLGFHVFVRSPKTIEELLSAELAWLDRAGFSPRARRHCFGGIGAEEFWPIFFEQSGTGEDVRPDNFSIDCNDRASRFCGAQLLERL